MDQAPRPGGVKKNGEPAYLQPYKRNGLKPMAEHAYIAYLPVEQFGPGMTSATEIRGKWPTMNDKQKIALIKTIYPMAAANEAAAAKLAEILDSVLGGNDVAETVVPVTPELSPLTLTPQYSESNDYIEEKLRSR
jgi:hypothetical protein